MAGINGKIKRNHLTGKAFLYVRQSTMRQVCENTESTKRQYALKDRLAQLGWDESQIEVIDSDLGQSGAQAEYRHGFQYLVSEVSLGRAGIIAGIEVSRLSRSSADWNKLLQIAAISDTLIMDEDGVYDVNDFNDRLLLGLKGTLSEAELHYLKARMRGGLLNKAKRGELKLCLAVGYVHNEDGQTVKDPDVQVQEAIARFFNDFTRIGSAFGVVRAYQKQGVLFPSRPRKGGELEWQSITLSKALRMLQNPLYAGIYSYGKTQVQCTVDGAKKINIPKERCHAWLPDSHPAYISEAQFVENNLIIAQNARPKPEEGHAGAVREGSALLQGIVICGKCGRMMSVRYNNSGHSRQPAYICEYHWRQDGQPRCQHVLGGNIDLTIERLLLETVNPMTMAAAAAIQQEMAQRKEEIDRLYSQQMERARYEMDLAKRRYLRVDPDNRLVAAELEREWNQKSENFESAKEAYSQQCEHEIRDVDEKLRRALEQLVTDFPKIWNDPATPSREKKRIARLVLEDVTITSDDGAIALGVRFKGGETKIIEIPNVARNLDVVKMEQAAIEEIRAMIPLGMTNRDIAAALNEKGLTTGISGNQFREHTINNLIRLHRLPKRSDIAGLDGWLTSSQKMAELGINDKTRLSRLRKAGTIVSKKCGLPGKAYLYKPENSTDV
jgi:DNA invertase Pin-like site-specific DNA recombinase